MLNVQTDRRHDRRALAPEEFASLIEAAERGKPIESISGPDRAMMYLLASWTGYRKGEIGSLTLASFDLDSEPPTVTVAAMYSKRKRTDTQVLHPLVVERLRDWLAGKPDSSRDQFALPGLWKSSWRNRAKDRQDDACRPGAGTQRVARSRFT
jgi:integrase